MSEQKDMILENFLSSAIRTLDTDEIYNILMDSLILLLHPQGLLLTQNLNTGRSFYTVRRWGDIFFEKDYDDDSYFCLIAVRSEDKDNPVYKRIVEAFQSESTKQIFQDVFKGFFVPAWE